MEPRRRGDAARRLATILQQLGQLLLDVEAMRPGAERARAACHVFAAHVRLEHALCDRPQWRHEGWIARAMPTLEAALEDCEAGSAGRLHARDPLLRLARQQLTGRRLAAGDRERLEGLAEGLWLRNDWAVRHRLVVELGTSPTYARALATTLSPSLRAKTARLLATGVLVCGGFRRFVGPIHDGTVVLFDPSVALAEALARKGEQRRLDAVLNKLGRTPRRKLDHLRAVAHEAVGDREAAAAVIARLPRTARRDQARIALAHASMARGDRHRARFHLDRLGDPTKRARLAAELAHAWLIDGVLARDLLAMATHAPVLDRTLLRGEAALVRNDLRTVLDVLGELARLLAQTRAELWAPMTTPHERAMRLLLAVTLSGLHAPPNLRFRRRTRRALLGGAFLRAELASCLRSDAALPRFAELRERAIQLPVVRDALDAVAIEHRARELCSERAIAASLDAMKGHVAEAPEHPHAALVAGALGGDVSVPSEATSVLRSAFDLGVALSPGAAKRRKRLVHAARACLRAPWSDTSGTAVRYRIRSLQHLRSHPGTELVTAVLQCGPRAGRAGNGLLSLLARYDPRCARKLLWSRFAVLTSHGERLDATLSTLRDARALGAPLVDAWQKAADKLTRERAREASGWWCSYVQRWWHTTGRPLTPLQLALIAEQAGTLHRDGDRSALRHAECAGRLVAKLANPSRSTVDDPALGWACAVFDPFPERPLSLDAWRATLRRLVDDVGEVDRPLVRALSGKLRINLARRVFAGRAPTLELEQPLDLGDGKHRLRYLCRRREPLALLRFADATPCCFATDGGHFYTGMQTERWVHRIFKDPLSFCFAVERDRPSVAGPVGFVFGGYATGDAGITLLLNGVYLRRSSAALRTAVLRTIESRLARPLGVASVGVAALHGGSGPLPDGYDFGSRRLTRLRALRRKNSEALEHQVYDDLGRIINAPADFRLYFRDLEAVSPDTRDA
jgi:hypothetical protein